MGASPRPRRPLVAINTYHRDDSERPRFNVPTGYVDAVRAAGGAIVLIPPGDAHPEELLEAVDALLMCGGGDLDPALFGASAHATHYSVCGERDAFDLATARAALARELPILAICRGMQVLNVALGGSLIQHLPDAVGEIVVHRADPPGPVPHLVKVEPDAVVAEAMGSAEVEIASWHHQAIDRLGDGLRVVAAASDGVVEAVELRGHAFVLAVQWHPELTADRDPTQQALFDALTSRARR